MRTPPASMWPRRQLLQAVGAGCLASLSPWSHAAKDDEIVIGQSVPLSGVLADTGRDMAMGGKICFDAINSQGGVQGRKIRHVVLDDGYDVERTLANTHELLQKHEALALFGFAGTGNIQRLLTDKVLANAGVALVGPYTGGEPLRTPYNPWIFHIRASYAEETSAMVKQLVFSGITNIGVFYQDDAFGQSGLQGVVSALAAANLDLTIAASFPKNTELVDSAVQAIAAKSPQAVILIATNRPVAAFLQKYRALSKSALFFNISVVNPKAIVQFAGADARGLSIAQVVPDPNGTKPIAQSYRADLAKFGAGAQVSSSSFEEYVAAKVLIEGLRRAKTLTRAGVIAGLESLERLDLGGHVIGFGPNNRLGSHFVEMASLRSDGRLIR